MHLFHAFSRPLISMLGSSNIIMFQNCLGRRKEGKFGRKKQELSGEEEECGTWGSGKEKSEVDEESGSP